MNMFEENIENCVLFLTHPPRLQFKNNFCNLLVNPHIEKITFLSDIHGVYTLTGGLLSAFMLLEQLFKVAPCGLDRDSAGTLSFSYCQTAHDMKF